MYQPNQQFKSAPVDEIQGDKLLWGVAIINLISLLLPVFIINAIFISISVTWFEFLSGFGLLIYFGGIALNFIAAKKIKEKPTIKRYNIGAGLLYAFLLLALSFQLDEAKALPDFISITLGPGALLLIVGTVGCFVSSFYSKNKTKDYLKNQIQFQQQPYNQMYQPNYVNQQSPGNYNPNNQYTPTNNQNINQSIDRSVIFCTSCGKQNTTQQSFCNNCGAKFNNEVDPVNQNQ